MHQVESTPTTELYPEIEPYSHGYLPVDNGHEIYYEQCGNREGLPVLFFHGGPGAGCDPKDRRYFNPEKWRVILSDQRGCGRSKPLGSLEANTTSRLLNDVGKLVNHLEIPEAVLWGGSWGSTMALL